MALCGSCLVGDFLLLLGGAVLVFYLLLQRLQNKWSQKGIPIVKANPVFGNMTDAIFRRKNLDNTIKDFYLQHKDKPFVTFFSFSRPFVMINDIELIKSVLIKDFNVFPDRNFAASPDDPMEYHSLFAQHGQKWKNMRSNLSPTFTSGKLKRMFDLIDQCGKDLVVYLNKETAYEGSVDVKEASARYTTDSVASVGFGIEGNALKDPDSEFSRTLRRSVTFSAWETVKNTLAFLYPTVIEKLNLILTKPEVTEFCRRIVWETVDYRQKKKIKRNDFLDLLLDLKNKGKVDLDENLEPDEHIEQTNEKIDLKGDMLVAQCFIFMVAGFETSSSTMTHALFELAQHPEIHEKLQEEIDSVLKKHGGKVTYEGVQEMTYLNMVVQETLRKYPLLSFLDRRAARAYRLPGTGITLEAGQSVMVPVSGLHYDPAFYPDPQRFDPLRFSEEGRQDRPSCTFLGFGEGPRNCIGMRLGLMQTKMGMIHILRNFSVSPTAETPLKIVFNSDSPLNQSKDKILLRFEKRVLK